MHVHPRHGIRKKTSPKLSRASGTRSCSTTTRSNSGKCKHARCVGGRERKKERKVLARELPTDRLTDHLAVGQAQSKTTVGHRRAAFRRQGGGETKRALHPRYTSPLTCRCSSSSTSWIESTPKCILDIDKPRSDEEEDSPTVVKESLYNSASLPHRTIAFIHISVVKVTIIVLTTRPFAMRPITTASSITRQPRPSNSPDRPSRWVG